MIVLPAEEIPVRSGDNDVRQYLQEIRQYPLLTPEEERQLAKACAVGDEEAIRTLVSSNLRLVVSVAREYAGRGVPLLDLVQEGSIGLLIAAKKFDYTRDVRFSTYATNWIRQRIGRYIMDHGELIRVPHGTRERVYKVLSARKELQQQQKEPTLQELAEACGIAEERVQSLLNLLPEIFSLDTPVGSDEETALQVLLEDVQAPQPEETLVREELKRTLESLLSGLDQRQQKVLRLHFGLEDEASHPLEEIGKIMGLSRERVRQIERQALRKLQEQGAGLGLEDFLV